MRTRKFIRRGLFVILALGVLSLTAFHVVERMMISRMRHDISQHVGDRPYAVVRMHSGGKPVRTPSLLRMLRLAWVYRFSDDYKPQGSGRFTGKKNYLLLLVSDNDLLHHLNWSFRRSGLVNERGPAWPDLIANLQDHEAGAYQFISGDRVTRKGLWFVSEINSPATTFYYWTSMKEEAQYHGHSLLDGRVKLWLPGSWRPQVDAGEGDDRFHAVMHSRKPEHTMDFATLTVSAIVLDEADPSAAFDALCERVVADVLAERKDNVTTSYFRDGNMQAAMLRTVNDDGHPHMQSERFYFVNAIAVHARAVVPIQQPVDRVYYDLFAAALDHFDKCVEIDGTRLISAEGE